MITESTDSLSAALAGRLAFLSQGTGRAEIRIYGGARPASALLPPTSPVLAPVVLQDPPGSVAGGSMTLLPDGPATIAATGIATWARAVNGDGATAFDMDAGVDGSPGKECLLSSATLAAGGVVTLTSAVLG